MKKFASLLLALILMVIVLPCSATEESTISIATEENTDSIEENVDDATEDTPSVLMFEEIFEIIKNHSTLCEDGTHIKLNFDTDKYYIYTEYRINETASKPKRQLYTFVNTLFNLITDVYDDTVVPDDNEEILVNCDFKVRHKNEDQKWEWLSSDLRITKSSVWIKTRNAGEHLEITIPISNADDIIEFLAVQAEEELSAFSKKKKDRTEPEVYLSSIEDYTYTDKMSFDFIVDETLEGVITSEVANIGETVSGSLEHYIKAYYNCYILTINGSKGEISLWDLYQKGLSSTLSSNLPRTFTSYKRVENGSLLNYDSDYIKADDFLILGTFKSGELSEVLIKYVPHTQTSGSSSDMTDALKCYNLKYETFEEDENSLAEEFRERDKEAEIEADIKENEKYDVEEQDPERAVTKVKGVRNDGAVIDYKITFIAEVSVETEMLDMPDWYKNLGDDVKATLVGFMLTVDGKEVRNYTMIRFSGSKDSVWFDNDTTKPWKKEDGKPITVDTTYNSLISFDGTEEVYNSVSHDTISTCMQFTNDEDMEIENIILSIGSADIKVNAENIKYIGGGKATYEKLW